MTIDLIERTPLLERYKCDEMSAVIHHVRCHIDDRSGKLVKERFDVELEVTDRIYLHESLDTLHYARGWMAEQFNYTKSILILKHTQ